MEDKAVSKHNTECNVRVYYKRKRFLCQSTSKDDKRKGSHGSHAQQHRQMHDGGVHTRIYNSNDTLTAVYLEPINTPGRILRRIIENVSASRQV